MGGCASRLARKQPYFPTPVAPTVTLRRSSAGWSLLRLLEGIQCALQSQFDHIRKFVKDDVENMAAVIAALSGIGSSKVTNWPA
jgi:hypothetical protein